MNFLSNNKGVIIGTTLSFLMIWRFNKNFKEYERAIVKEKVFDIKRANEQLKLYKEIYDPTKENNTLMKMANEEEKESIQKLFNKYDKMDKDEINSQIDSIKKQLELMEERKTKHQGIKLAKVMYGYEPSEEALKKLRENYKNKEKNNE